MNARLTKKETALRWRQANPGKPTNEATVWELDASWWDVFRAKNNVPRRSGAYTNRGPSHRWLDDLQERLGEFVV